MAALDPLAPSILRRICDVLGDTGTGLTGREIGELLYEAKIEDLGEMTKRHRLYEAMRARQERDGASNAVLRALEIALNPAGFLSEPGRFEVWQEEISQALRFAGLEIDDSGHITVLSKPATTLSEARKRANRFKESLRDRGVHASVIASCSSEIADENYFHAVFETAKGLADRIRDISGLSEDGTTLVDRAFGRGRTLPMVAFNRLETQTDASEHDGYANMLRGLFGAFRNTTAHRPKVSWPIAEQDALDMMSTASLLHRRLDSAVVVPEHLRSR